MGKFKASFTSFQDLGRHLMREVEPQLTACVAEVMEKEGYRGFPLAGKQTVGPEDIAIELEAIDLGKDFLMVTGVETPESALDASRRMSEIDIQFCKRERGVDNPLNPMLAHMLFSARMFDTLYDYRDGVERMLDHRVEQAERACTDSLEPYESVYSVRLYRYLQDRLGHRVNLRKVVERTRGFLARRWSGRMVLNYLTTKDEMGRELGLVKGSAARDRTTYKKAMETSLIGSIHTRRELYRGRGLDPDFRRELNAKNVEYQEMALEVVDNPAVLSYLATELRRLARREKIPPDEREELFEKALALYGKVPGTNETYLPSFFTTAEGLLTAKWEGGKGIDLELLAECCGYAEASVNYVVTEMGRNMGRWDRNLSEGAHLISHVFENLDALFRRMGPDDSGRSVNHRGRLRSLHARFCRTAYDYSPPRFRAPYRQVLFC